jgi:hypothetical protein
LDDRSFPSFERTPEFMSEIQIPGNVGKGALSKNLRPQSLGNIMKLQVFCHDRFMHSTWNDEMVDYWNSGYRKIREQISAFLPVNPSFQYSIIPIF